MRLAIVLMMALFPLHSASAEYFVFPKNGISYSMPMPAEHWFNRPLIGELFIHRKSRDKVATFCTMVVNKFEDMGCVDIIPGHVCAIHINEEMPQELFDAVYRHELAHCHGWPGDHPTD